MATTLKIDWNKNGNFTGTYDDVSGYVIGDIDWSIGFRPYMSMADESYLRATLYNNSKLFSPDNASGALYGLLVPGRPVQFTLNSTVMFTGYLASITPSPFLYGDNRAVIECEGAMSKLRRLEYFPKLYEDVTADVFLADVATQVVQPAIASGWVLGVAGFSELGTTTFLGDAANLYSLDTGDTTFPYIGDNVRAVEGNWISAYEVVQDVIEAERGRLWFDRDGRMVFARRNRWTNMSTPDVTVDNDAQSETYVTSFDNLVTQVDVTGYPRIESATAGEELWRLNQPLIIGAGATRELWVNHKNANAKQGWIGAKDIVVPSGGDLSATDSGSLTITLDSKAQRTKMTISNSSSAANTITTMILRGRSIDSYDNVTYRAEAADLLDTYGIRSRKLSLRAVSDPDDVAQIADYELHLHSQVKGRIESITYNKKADGTANQNQLDYGIGDIANAIDDQIGTDDNYIITMELHYYDVTNQMHETTWMLEPLPTTTFWSLGDTGFSELGDTTILGY